MKNEKIRIFLKRCESRRNDIIVVMVQYRLGLYGFLNSYDSHEEKTVGGNYGLMDQQLAMKFIHANAENIGGDPDRISIIGESAGGQARVKNWARI